MFTFWSFFLLLLGDGAVEESQWTQHARGNFTSHKFRNVLPKKEEKSVRNTSYNTIVLQFSLLRRENQLRCRVLFLFYIGWSPV